MVFLLLGDVNFLFNAECLYRQVPVFIVLFHYITYCEANFPRNKISHQFYLLQGAENIATPLRKELKKEKNREQPFWKCSVIRNKEAYFHKTVFVSLRLPCTENRKIKR